MVLRTSAAIDCPNRDAAEHSFPSKSMSLREGRKVFLLLLFKSVLNIKKVHGFKYDVFKY